MNIFKLIQDKLESSAPNRRSRKITLSTIPVALGAVSLVYFLRHLLPSQNPALITLLQIIVFLLVVSIALYLLYQSSLKTISSLSSKNKLLQSRNDELSEGIQSYFSKHSAASQPPKSLDEIIRDQLSGNT